MAEEDLSSIEGRARELKKMLVKTFDGYCDSSMHTLKHHLPDHAVEGIRRSRTLSVLDSSSYEHFNLNIKQAYEKTLQERRTRIIEMINVIKKLREGVSIWKEGERWKIGMEC